MIISKDTSHMGTLTMKEISKKRAKGIILLYHYSHKWQATFGKINIGIFKDDILLGVASFGRMMNTKSFKNFSDDLTEEGIVELNRLWIDDRLGKNAETILLGASWKIIKKCHPEVKVVQSFADGRLGCGTIYKAANFKYYGFHLSKFFEYLETGEVLHKKLFEDTMSVERMIETNKNYILGKIIPFNVKTYRYIYLLDKRIKIKFKEESYPPYQKERLVIENYIHPKSLIFRSYILSYIIDDDSYKIFEDYIKTNYSEQVIFSEMSIGLTNETVLLKVDTQKRISKYNKLVTILNNDTILPISTNCLLLDKFSI